MHLLVVRHATAEPQNAGTDDAARELTREGIRKARHVVAGLRELDWRLDHVLTSPWRRALHTAELLAPIAHGAPVTTDLLCQPPRDELLARIAETAGGNDRKRHATAVVGHQPWLGELVSWLVLGAPGQGSAFELKKASVVWLDGTAAPGAMKLRALFPPGPLRELA